MLKWLGKKRNQKGFTLIELVVVILILGILAAIAIPRLGKSRESASIAKEASNIRIVKGAAAMYIADRPNDFKLDETSVDTDFLEYLDGGMAENGKGDLLTVAIDDNGVITVGNIHHDENKPEKSDD